jgi:cell division protein FtsI/penicillin-binding protein 2
MSPQRLWTMVALLALAALAVAARSTQIMVVEHDRWVVRAHRQQQRVIASPGRRGTIRSADGYVLATSQDRVAVQVNTRHLRYPELFARSAAAILGVEADELGHRLGGRPRAVWVAQRVEQKTAATVQALAPAAVALVPDSTRVYPLGRTAAPVIGFTGREELLTVGRVGLEQQFDDLLKGEPARYLAVRDAVQRQLRTERLHPGRSGYDLELTLQARLQAASEQHLENAVADLHATAASAVVLDATTGDVLALASVPSFDPANPAQVDRECWRLRPVQAALEPGSTIKPFVAAAALGHGAVRAGEALDCTAQGISVAGVWIRDHADPGIYTLDDVVAVSSNTGIITVAERLQPTTLWHTLRGFGFGQRSGLGFAGEAIGVLQPPDRWSRLSRAGLAIGQELTVSPLQLALAYAAIANGGWLPRPRLVRRAWTGDSELATEPAWRRRVLDDNLASRLRHMLERVVLDGTGELAALTEFRVAGKTGTAQRAVAGGFNDRNHVAWFAGFCPLPEPRFVVVVAVEQPREDYWASTVAAPLFAVIARDVAHQLGLEARRGVPPGDRA